MIREQHREAIVERLFKTRFLRTSAGISKLLALCSFPGYVKLDGHVLLNAMLHEDLHKLSVSL